MLDLAEVADGISGRYDLADETQRATAWHRLDEHAETLESAEARQALFRRLCAALDIDATTIAAERLCAFMTLEEARELRSEERRVGQECVSTWSSRGSR